MKSLFALLAIFCCLNSTAQELKPLKPILDSGVINSDNPQLAYAMKRCITLNLVMGNWMQEKGGERMKNAVDNFFIQAQLLKEVSFDIENKIEKERKVKITNKNDLEKSLISSIKLITPMYIDRLTKNYAASGSYFDNDEQLKEEIFICADFQKYLKSVR
jgi:hypothetical protein